jgi:hypothetical protein
VLGRHWVVSWAWAGLTLAAATSFAWTATASALSGTAVNVGSPLAITGLSVGVDPSGTSYVAWANSKELPPVATDVVQYCVLPPGSSNCAHTGTLTPANGAAQIDSVQVLVDGTVVVILADVRGAKSNDYVPEQEWQSTDGGSSFTAVDGGRSVADGTINSSTFPLNAVVVPGTDALGYGWQTAGSEPPTFDEFPFTSPPECAVMTCAPDEAFATLAPASEPDQIGDAGGEFASELGTNPGVLGVFNINFASGNLACPVAPSDTNFGAAFVYGSGPQSPTNSYDIPPGQSDSAWKVPVTEAFCDSYPLAVAGGPSGFGVLEIADPHRGGSTNYQRFDQATMKFVARTARPPARPRLRDRPGETRGPDAVVRASRVRADNRANPLSTVPSRDGHDLPAVAKPSPRPARDDPARPRTIGHRHRQPLRMEHDQRIHRQLPTRPRADSRRLPGPHRRIARGTAGRRPDQAGPQTQPCQSRRDCPFNHSTHTKMIYVRGAAHLGPKPKNETSPSPSSGT